MSKNQNVAIKINESALIKNLKFAFSNAFTVMAELLQNCRRAGATKIDILSSVVDEKVVLTIIDNGTGVDDFQKMLTIAESGWDEKIAREEHAFGMGFLSALFSASRVIVQSNGRTLDMDTEHMISMKDVQILPISSFAGPGTSVTLFDVDMNVLNSIRNLVKGFPVPVFLDGKELDRPYAVSDKFSDTEVGKFYVNKDVLKQGHKFGMGMYGSYFLQGLKVYSDSSLSYDYIVHLDSTKFFGRMPDRDKLVNEQEVKTAVREVLYAMIGEFLESRLAALGEQGFCDEYGSYIINNCREFLLKLNTLLPKEIVKQIDSLAVNSDIMQMSSVKTLTRADIESGETLLFSEPDFYEDEGSVAMQFIQHFGNAFILSYNLPECHWASSYVLEPENDEFKYEIINEHRRAGYSGEYIGVDVVLCEKVVLSLGERSIELTDEAIYADGMIIVPDFASEFNAGDTVDVVNQFFANDAYDEYGRDRDSIGVRRTVVNLRTQDFGKAIRDAVCTEGVDSIGGVEGKRYMVSFLKGKNNSTSDVVVVEFGELLANLKLDVSEKDIEKAVKAIAKKKSK